MKSYAYLKYHKNHLSKNINKVYEHSMIAEPFKITNKRTINILNQRPIKPIHKRIDDIIAKKQFKINMQELVKLEK